MRKTATWLMHVFTSSQVMASVSAPRNKKLNTHILTELLMHNRSVLHCSEYSTHTYELCLHLILYAEELEQGIKIMCQPVYLWSEEYSIPTYRYHQNMNLRVAPISIYRLERVCGQMKKGRSWWCGRNFFLSRWNTKDPGLLLMTSRAGVSHWWRRLSSLPHIEVTIGQ